ncbi:hypothetical protein [Streptomyces sp. NPDC051554]|uniref:hypothetical protein n=1 Tax=Streptomyces sp. NPDC051554 TaxID=3365656 RepID=UPI003795CA9E
MKLANKPVRVHWRHRDKDPAEIPVPSRAGRVTPGTPNPVTGKLTVGKKYAPSTRGHFETVLRTFYDFHLERNTGSLLVNPFPLVRDRRSSRANAHHNPGKEPSRRGATARRPGRNTRSAVVPAGSASASFTVKRPCPFKPAQHQLDLRRHPLFDHGVGLVEQGS